MKLLAIQATACAFSCKCRPYKYWEDRWPSPGHTTTCMSDSAFHVMAQGLQDGLSDGPPPHPISPRDPPLKLQNHRPSSQPTAQASNPPVMPRFTKPNPTRINPPPPPQCMLSQGVGSSQQTDSCRRSHTQLEAVLPQPRGEGQEVGPPLHHPAGHRCGGLEDGQMNLWQLPTRLLLCFQHCHHRRTCVGSLSTASLSGKTQALRHTSVVLSVSLKPACSAGDCSVRKPTSRILPLIF